MFTDYKEVSDEFIKTGHTALVLKCRSLGEPLVTPGSIWLARDLNVIPHAPDTNATPLRQLVDPNNKIKPTKKKKKEHATNDPTTSSTTCLSW